MRKKAIIFSLLGITLISGLLIVLISSFKNDKVYIDYNGVLAAVTLDGESVTSFPSGEAYRVEVDCINASAKWLPDEWKLSVERITGNFACSLDFKTRTNDDKLVNVVVDKANVNKNGHRYSGKNVANYIWFNDEMWRIIGVIPTVVDENGTVKNLVKIIRNDSIGGLSYDYDSSSLYNAHWSNCTLNDLLNNHYFNSGTDNMNGQSHNGCFSNGHRANCDYRTIGIVSTSFYGSMVEEVYWNVGASSINSTADESYENEITSQNILGHIGLMSASDYGYASASNFYQTEIGQYDYAANKNWLYSAGYEWTITKGSGDDVALAVRYAGEVVEFTARNGLVVRPVVYLDENLFVVSGNGTITYPYMISD